METEDRDLSLDTWNREELENRIFVREEELYVESKKGCC